MTQKRRRGKRPVGRPTLPTPEPIPDTPENVAKAVLTTSSEQSRRLAVHAGLQSEQT